MYSRTERARARKLFVEEELSYDEVAEETGISRSQVYNWAQEDDWVKARKEMDREFREIDGNLHKLKLEVINKALESKHAQDVHAAINLLKAAPIGRKTRGHLDRARLFIEWMTGLIEYLKGQDGEALRYLEPHIRGFAEAMKENN